MINDRTKEQNKIPIYGYLHVQQQYNNNIQNTNTNDLTDYRVLFPVY